VRIIAQSQGNLRNAGLLREDGEWFCSLSECPSVPLELDDTADAHLEDTALVILSAFLEAERKAMTETYEDERGGVRARKGPLLDCENFA
jgi:hypothetical protein